MLTPNAVPDPPCILLKPMSDDKPKHNLIAQPVHFSYSREMHLVYNRSSISHKYDFWRINNQSFKRTQYTTIEKMMILRVIKKMVKEEQVTYAQASSALSFNKGMISCWRKEQDQFAAQASSRPDALSLHAGPNNILKNVEEQLIAYVDEWPGKGLLVNRFTLMQKACSLIPELSKKSEHVALVHLSLHEKNRHGHSQGTVPSR